MEASESRSKELNSTVSKIEKVSQKRFSKALVIVFALLLLFAYLGIRLEKSSNERELVWKVVYWVDHYVKCFLKRKPYSEIDFSSLKVSKSYIDKSKDVVKEILNSWAEVSLSYNGIIAATIILFYSIMENKQEGIANRRIMAFAFGSATTPFMFCTSMILLIVYYVFWQSNYYFISLFTILYVLIIQFFVIVMILFSASHYGHNKIVPMIEAKQLKCLIENRTLTNKYKIHIWTYFTRHMSEALTSSEIVADQMVLVRGILEVPIRIDEKNEKKNNSKLRKVHRNVNSIINRFLTFSGGENNALSRHICSMTDMVCIGLGDYYAFYYNNLINAFERLQYKELELDALMGSISDLLIKISIKRITEEDNDRKTMDQISMIFSATINALYAKEYNSVISPTDRCVALYNQIIAVIHNSIGQREIKEKNRIEQIEERLFLIYVFFLGFLFYSEKDGNLYEEREALEELNSCEENSLKIDCRKNCIFDRKRGVPVLEGIQKLKGIKSLDKKRLQIDKQEDKQFIFDVWRNWTEASNIGVYRFVKVLNTYNQKSRKCFAVYYIMSRL